MLLLVSLPSSILGKSMRQEHLLRHSQIPYGRVQLAMSISPDALYCVIVEVCYIGYYASCPAGTDVAGTDVSTVSSWGAAYNTVQFGDSGVDCKPQP